MLLSVSMCMCVFMLNRLQGIVLVEQRALLEAVRNRRRRFARPRQDLGHSTQGAQLGSCHDASIVREQELFFSQCLTYLDNISMTILLVIDSTIIMIKIKFVLLIDGFLVFFLYKGSNVIF